MSLFSDPENLYSGKSDFYAKYRPSYPPEVFIFLREELGLNAGSVVAEIGSGTGVFTRQLLETGCRVHGVEPNPEMRAVAEKSLAAVPGFLSIEGTAESTTLKPSSVDLIVAAQSFHWFDGKKARTEFVRVLKSGGWIALVWNERRVRGSAFLEDFEALLRAQIEDYGDVVACGERMNADLTGFFGAAGYGERMYATHQDLNLDGLVGRFLSSSFAPKPANPRFSEIRAALAAVYSRHARGSGVRIEYDTRLVYGQLTDCGRVL